MIDRIHDWRAGWGLALAVLCVAGTAPAHAAERWVPLRVDESSRSYPVDAVDLETLREQIDLGRPMRRDGRPSHGLLQVDLGLHYRLLPEAGGCRLESPEVRLKLVVSLPEWQPSKIPSPALEDAWNQMRSGLVLHEEGHREMALETGRELAERVAALPAWWDDCGVLRRELLAARLSHVTRLALRSAAYDRRTVHGERQGAVLVLDDPGLDACDRRDSALRQRCVARRR